MKNYFSILLFLLSLIKNSINLVADCGTKYGCFKIPSDCEESNCDYIIKWHDNGTSTNFIMQTKPMQSNFYLAIGFSYNRKMGEDCVVMCKYNQDGRSSIEHYYNPRKEKNSEVLDPNDRSIGLSLSTITIDDNFLTCSFKRLKSIKNVKEYYDLNNMYYLLMVKGYLDPDNEPTNHKKNKFSSSNLINFNLISKEKNDSRSKYTKLHAVLMISSWMILATFGAIFARYFKFLNWHCKLLATEFWFAVHRTFMTLVPIFTLTGLAAILYAKEFELIQPGLNSNFVHSILGFVTIAFSIIQPIFAIFRPSKNSENRPCFNLLHKVFGFLTILSAMGSIVVGSLIFLNNEKWIVFYAWVGWLISVIFLLEFADYKIKKDKDEPLIESENEQTQSHQTFLNEKYKLLILIIHVIASFVMVGLMNLFVYVEIQ